MPHALIDQSQEISTEQENLLIQQALDPSNHDFDWTLEPGEKADNAVDYEDLSDGDLAEDEDENNVTSLPRDKVDTNGGSFDDLVTSTQEDGLPDLTSGSGPDGDDIDYDELFGGDEGPSSPVDIREADVDTQPLIQQDGANIPFDFGDDVPYTDPTDDALKDTFQPKNKSANIPEQPLFRAVNFSTKDDNELLLQRQLFAMSGSGFDSSEYPPAPPENQEELLATLWPQFERDAVPRFAKLLALRKARYVGKTPVKTPKPVQPTKVSLDIATDQEKNFKVNTGSHKRTLDDLEQSGIVTIPSSSPTKTDTEEDVEMDSDYENEVVGGATWQDLQMVCTDWDIATPPSPDPIPQTTMVDEEDLFRDIDQRWSDQAKGHSAKRRKFNNFLDFITPQFALPSLHDPEYATAQIARTVVLDLNDPLLLIDENVADNSHQAKKVDLTNGDRGAFSKRLSRRYNISNDEAYDLLKENHQSRVRSTLGNLTVNHSMPAQRLQWPYYKTKLAKQEARSFHRPLMSFHKGEPIIFSKPRIVKKKHLKGKDTQAIFEKTKDLSMGDNSHVLLLEYSEEHPAMMSNFGMGSRLVNYYRRKNMEDTQRPKLDIGETTILLPQDKSPFSTFGHVDAGEITPTIHNGMYRAPVFKQEPRSTDFLVIRSSTHAEGSSWYLRNIENLQLVGQEFPSIDVPGPHSRKVTTASKNRLKMISYRKLRKNKPHRISVDEVTEHFLDTTDMQNRQKMKEFMVFSKEHKQWEMRPGEAIPDEDAIRSMVKPEDVCLLESMQVGQQHLEDAGFSKGDDESEGEDGKEGQSIEQQLAPWYTSRNFLNAAQGKAMLQLHGEGDPTGRGEAFSFIKTSMKGGFKAMGESVEDKLDAKKLKELGGHTYNVARQQKSYEDSIRRIWDGQKQSLSSTLEHSDSDTDPDDAEAADDAYNNVETPRSELQTPAAFRRLDDETGSQFSKFSTDSQAGKVLRIWRNVKNNFGQIERISEVVRDPRVIRQYLKRRHAKEAETIQIGEIKITGDTELDRRNKLRLEKELARLERNKERRVARDKQKGIHVDGPAGSPGSPNSPVATNNAKGTSTGTQRKCANCGQIGHIKTNKKLCPLLNGTMKQEEGFGGSAFAPPPM